MTHLSSALGANSCSHVCRLHESAHSGGERPFQVSWTLQNPDHAHSLAPDQARGLLACTGGDLRLRGPCTQSGAARLASP
jgi:hypothetical protein